MGHHMISKPKNIHDIMVVIKYGTSYDIQPKNIHDIMVVIKYGTSYDFQPKNIHVKTDFIMI